MVRLLGLRHGWLMQHDVEDGLAGKSDTVAGVARVRKGVTHLQAR